MLYKKVWNAVVPLRIQKNLHRQKKLQAPLRGKSLHAVVQHCVWAAARLELMKMLTGRRAAWDQENSTAPKKS